MEAYSKILTAGYIVFVVLVLLDIGLTHYGLQKSNVKEYNPIVKQNYSSSIIVKVMSLCMIGAVVFYAIVSYNNINVIFG